MGTKLTYKDITLGVKSVSRKYNIKGRVNFELNMVKKIYEMLPDESKMVNNDQLLSSFDTTYQILLWLINVINDTYLGKYRFISIDDLIKTNRKTEVKMVRHYMAFFLVEEFGWSKSEVARHFVRNHATIINSIKAIEDFKDTEANELHRYNTILSKINNLRDGNPSKDKKVYKDGCLLKKQLQKSEVYLLNLSGSKTFDRNKAKVFPTREKAIIYNSEYLNNEFTPELKKLG